MAENETRQDEANIDAGATNAGKKKGKFSWMELLSVVALPLVTLFLGFLFNKSLNERQMRETNALNERQTRETNTRLYIEMMGRREQADSDLRKDMFRSILDTFMSKGSNLNPDQQLRQQVLDLELLAYNFHESLDIAPLFKDVRSRIPDDHNGPYAALRHRLERVAHEVIERQLTVVSDGGAFEKGYADPRQINNLKAYLSFGSHTVPTRDVTPGNSASRVCLSLQTPGGELDYRQFKLEPIRYDALTREVSVHLYVSKTLNHANCLNADLDDTPNAEIDTNFWVGLFDFPMIDNTRLTNDERCAVSLTALTPTVITMALAYFPGSHASLKDKPYYDEVLRKTLVESRRGSEPGKYEPSQGTP